ncbi:hypothetical protein SAMN05421869_10596 [Nonomuraea jiangxiensis]|uniref:Uncharacterized protein n=1 Tax=Nonomuraea jiangxiensis TaxID=633440 RepID=A0A1G8JI77_9ACTN|nr:hypothetical protein SAMN05421869_10596 [Nonomuraea jiangxiensis]
MHGDGHEDVLPVLEGDAATARTRVLGQVAACRERYGEAATAPVSARGRAADPLQALREGAHIDPVRVATMRLEIDRAFSLLRDERIRSADDFEYHHDDSRGA